MWKFVFLGRRSYTYTTSIYIVFATLAFTAWNAYIIVDLKLSNSGLLKQSETVWGFGQVLAVGLLAALFLQLFEAAKGS